MPYRNVETWSLVGAILIGLISGFVSITRRITAKKAVSKLWLISECAGVVLVTVLAMDVYPQLKPTLMSHVYTSWITYWLFVGVCAHIGSRLMYLLEKRFISKFFAD